MKNNDLFGEAARLRREAGEKSVEVFAQLFLSHYLEKKSCAFHKELYAMLSEMTAQRGEHLAIAAPRSNGKSAIVSTIYVLWCVCYRKDDYIIVISDTRDQAEDHLSHVKTELEENERLKESFPEVCEMGQKPMPPRWTRSEIITRNGIKITALGSGQKIRGRRNREIRPSLIILDDIENDENTQSEESREKLFSWFVKAVIKAGSERTNVVVIGTIQHYDSLLANLTGEDAMPGWNSRIYKSVITWAANQDLWQRWAAIFNNRDSYKDATGKKAARDFYADTEMSLLEGTAVLWPEMEDYYALMVLREQGLASSFDSEMQNDPFHNNNELYFNPKDMHFWDDEFATEEELLSAIGENGQFFGACDNSFGTQDRYGGYSAIVTAVWDSERRVIYVIDADIKRRLPDMLITDIQGYHRKRRYQEFAFDADQPHGFMIDELGRRSGSQELSLTIKQVTHRTDELAKIQTLQPMIKYGVILFSRKHLEIHEQMKSFPTGKHDNILNALVMALEPCIQLSKIPVFYLCGVAPGGKIVSKMKITKKGWIPVPISEGEMAKGFPIKTSP